MRENICKPQGLILIIYKELLKLSKQSDYKMGKRYENTFHRGAYADVK